MDPEPCGLCVVGRLGPSNHNAMRRLGLVRYGDHLVTPEQEERLEAENRRVAAAEAHWETRLAELNYTIAFHSSSVVIPEDGSLSCSSTRVPSAGLVETPALTSFSGSTDRKRNSLTKTPTTNATSS